MSLEPPVLPDPAEPLGGVYLALGSNLGDPARHLEAGRTGLPDRGIRLLRSSRIYRTAPVGGPPQGGFLNQVIEVATSLEPPELLEEAHALERSRGRRRETEVRWGPRTLDIDLLLFRGQTLSRPGLEVPHPRMHLRRFVLAPLAELAPDLVHPVFGVSIRKLLAGCEDPGEIVPENGWSERPPVVGSVA